jgi:hypothetical protein
MPSYDASFPLGEEVWDERDERGFHQALMHVLEVRVQWRGEEPAHDVGDEETT